MTAPLAIAVLLGSSREGRFLDHVAAWLRAAVGSDPRFALDVLDPRELGLPEAFPAGDTPALRAYAARIGRADGFILVTPEYNHSYPAALKTLIDSARDEWRRKPAAFVSYGGIAGGLRAVEHLRHVLAELQTVGLRDGVSFHSPWSHVGEDGDWRVPAQTGRALAAMLDGLDWWGRALRSARAAGTADPAPAVADAYTLVNVFRPVPGRLDDLLDLQLEETAALNPVSSRQGWLGNEVYRATDDSRPVVVTRFRDRAAQAAWAQSPDFVAHLERIRPLIASVELTPVTAVAAHAAEPVA